MQNVAWELIMAILVAAIVLSGLIYAMFTYNMQSNRLEFEVQKICIEGGGTYIRFNQQCLFPAMPSGKAAQ